MAAIQILIVDDDLESNQLIMDYLSKESFQAAVLYTGTDVIPFVKFYKPALIIMNTQLSGMDGFDCCRELRKFSQIPIIFISRQASDMDIILGLEVGADDFVTKPYSPAQLIARVKSNLRRPMLDAAPQAAETLYFEGMEIDIANRDVKINNKRVPLSTKEFGLLVTLAKHPKRIFKMDELYQRIWKNDCLGDTRTLIVHMSNLRKKLQADNKSPEYILTVRGEGYKFNHTLREGRR